MPIQYSCIAHYAQNLKQNTIFYVLAVKGVICLCGLISRMKFDTKKKKNDNDKFWRIIIYTYIVQVYDENRCQPPVEESGNPTLIIRDTIVVVVVVCCIVGIIFDILRTLTHTGTLMLSSFVSFIYAVCNTTARRTYRRLRCAAGCFTTSDPTAWRCCDTNPNLGFYRNSVRLGNAWYICHINLAFENLCRVFIRNKRFRVPQVQIKIGL